MNPTPKASSKQMEASGAPASPEVAAGALPHGAGGSEANVAPRGGGKEAGRILFGLAVLGVGLLAANRGRQ